VQSLHFANHSAVRLRKFLCGLVSEMSSDILVCKLKNQALYQASVVQVEFLYECLPIFLNAAPDLGSGRPGAH
jgi:hypothetical protein